jgi:glycosyltransferase involved in cell wall biosynthesis
MHILYLHQYFVPPDGSGGTRSYEMAKRFVLAGHKVTMITSSAFFPAHYNLQKGVNYLNLEGIELIVVDVPYSNKLPFIQRIFAFVSFAAKSLMQSLKVKDVDVVFATSTPLTIAIPGIAAKYKHRCPMVFEVRDLWPEIPIAIGALRNPILKALAALLERTAYAQSSHVVALSTGMKEGVVKTGFPTNLVTVVPNSCDVDLFSRHMDTDYFSNIRLRKDQPIVLYAGTLGIINGLEYMVELAEAMLKVNPDVCFIVAGDGNQKQLVLEKAREKGVLGINFWLTPPVPKDKMPDLLASCTVMSSFVINIPQLWHNSANKFFDTFAAGKPIMINYGGWQANVIAATGAGLVVPPDSPSTAALLLNGFLNDDVRQENACQAAKVLADTEFNRDHLFEKLRKVLEGVLSTYK